MNWCADWNKNQDVNLSFIPRRVCVCVCVMLTLASSEQLIVDLKFIEMIWFNLHLLMDENVFIFANMN